MKRLSDAEEMVMSVIWNNDELMSLEEIRKKSYEKYGKDWKPQTVSTFLARLREKGFVSFEKKGRYCFYTPIVCRQEYVKMSYSLMVTRFYCGDAEKMEAAAGLSGRAAGWLLAPYLLWVTFAAYLNAGIWLLNQA